ISPMRRLAPALGCSPLAHAPKQAGPLILLNGSVRRAAHTSDPSIACLPEPLASNWRSVSRWAIANFCRPSFARTLRAADDAYGLSHRPGLQRPPVAASHVAECARSGRAAARANRG